MRERRPRRAKVTDNLAPLRSRYDCYPDDGRERTQRRSRSDERGTKGNLRGVDPRRVVFFWIACIMSIFFIFFFFFCGL